MGAVHAFLMVPQFLTSLVVSLHEVPVLVNPLLHFQSQEDEEQNAYELLGEVHMFPIVPQFCESLLVSIHTDMMLFPSCLSY